MKVNEFISNGQSQNDDRFLAEVIEKFVSDYLSLLGCNSFIS